MEFDFDKIYEKLILSAELQELEKKRFEVKKYTIIGRLILLPIILIFHFLILYGSLSDLFYEYDLFSPRGIFTVMQVALPTLVWVVVLFWLVLTKFKWGYSQFNKNYKDNVTTKMANIILPEMQYYPSRGISIVDYVRSGLYFRDPITINCDSQDLFIGKIDKTTFQFSEVLEWRNRFFKIVNGKRERATIPKGRGIIVTKTGRKFKGVFFMADFHKDFNGFTVITRNNSSKIVKYINSTKAFDNLNKVKLENSAFEKIFDVYSTDQVESRYLLSPLIMERLVEINKKFSAKITFSFRESMIYIAVPQKTNHFEAPIFSSMLSKKKLETEFGLLVMLIEIIKDLNLNTRIWSKK